MGVRNLTLARLALAMLVVVVILGGLASTAGAAVYTDPLTHHRFGVVPTPASVASAQNGSSVCTVFGSDTCSALVYHGGPVQHAEQDYLFFWAPSSYASAQLSAYETGMSQWVTDLAGADYSASTPVSAAQQYYDNSGTGGAKQFIPFAVKNAGMLIDTTAYPVSGGCSVSGYSACLTEAQLATELSSYIRANGLPTGLGVEYFILTPAAVDTCTDTTNSECAYSGYCGYHTYAYVGGVATTLADLPWTYQTGCDVGSPSVLNAGYANTDYIDSTVGVFSHELSETMTDPALNAWYGVNGGADEIGDKCAYNYGGPGGAGDLSGLQKDSNGGDYNVQLGNDYYLLQLEYDNRTTNCQLNDTDSQPSASLSVPAEVGTGAPTTFSLSSVTDPAGIAYVNWSFGDGSTTQTTGTSAQHVYVAPGDRQVAAIVTDNDGNELRLTASTTVVATPPSSTSPPTISGTDTVGQTLFEAHGSWKNLPTNYSYQWEDCASSGSGCTPIAGATAQSYVLSAHDVDHRIRVLETGYNGGGGGPADASSETALVQPNPAAVDQLLAVVVAASRQSRNVKRLIAGKSSISFAAPSAGTLTLVWREPHGGHQAIARGAATLGGLGSGKVRLKLTPKGKSVLKHLARHKPLVLIATVTFTPAGGTTSTLSRKLTLKR